MLRLQVTFFLLTVSLFPTNSNLQINAVFDDIGGPLSFFSFFFTFINFFHFSSIESERLYFLGTYMISRRGFLKLSLSVAALSAMPAELEAFSGYGYSKPTLIRDFQNSYTESVFTSRDYFEKIRRFNQAFADDMIAGSEEFALIKSCCSKTYSLMRYVGFGNFNVLNFDDAVKYANNVDILQPFTKAELDYIEMLFSRDAAEYGFYGEKIFSKLTDRVDVTKMVKVPGSGHYIYKSGALGTYKKITAEMSSLTLTSGVRSVVKQMHLFSQ